MSGGAALSTAVLVLVGGIMMADQEVRLPEPSTTGSVPVERAIGQRRSVRDFRSTPLDLEQVSQLLWAAQGITGPSGLRAAPSAGALHPLEVFLVAGAVNGLPAGTYRYSPRGHRLRPVAPGDRRDDLARAAVGQLWIRGAPASIVVAAVYSRTTGRYGERGRRYVHMEVGHVAQNVYLQAAAMGLGTTMVGAFDDDAVATALGMQGDERPLGILPLGVPR